MTRTFTHSIELAAPPARVFTVLSDPAELVARYLASGSQDVEVLEHRPEGDGGLVVVYRRVEAGALPAPIAKLVRGAAQVTQTDTWLPALPAQPADGVRIAQWVVRTKGVAVAISGTIELAAHGAGTRLTESGTITARMPLVGALIERLAVEQSEQKLRLEWAWLAAQL